MSERLVSSTHSDSHLARLLELHLSMPGYLKSSIRAMIAELEKKSPKAQRTESKLGQILKEYHAMNKLLSLAKLSHGNVEGIQRSRLKQATNTAVCFLHNSLPYANAGYATRAHGILQGLRSHGIDVCAYTRPGFPEDCVNDGFCLSAGETSNIEIIDNITYGRLSSDIRRRKFEYVYMLHSYYEYLRLLEDISLILS